MKSKRRVAAIIVLVAGACLTVPWVYRLMEKWRADQIAQMAPFRFPSIELAALDRDLQARFAVVPTKMFGIERAYGPQHGLYAPENAHEKQSIANLKKNGTDAAFYLMSRALWLCSWDGWGYKPIQGPVYITRHLDLPLPRKDNFVPEFDAKGKRKEKLFPSQPRDVIAHNPEGTPVPAPTPPVGAPDFRQLQGVGNRVFELAENAHKTQKIGVTAPFGRWQVAAVPIRASKQACLHCHIYSPMGKDIKNPSGRTKIEVGDALGVAFYLYSRSDGEIKERR